jgi:uncharacterized membrane protein
MNRNISDWQRWGSIAAGAGLLLLPGGRRRRPLRAAAKALGAGLVLRGASGYCPITDLAHDRSAGDTRRALGGSAGINVSHSVTIDRPVSEVYGFWRNLENLPRVMRHLDSVRLTSPNRSQWIARGPTGRPLSWDAETINEIENRLVAWRSLENAEVVSAGSVNFAEAPGGQGTDVRVSMQYAPPGGRLGAAVAWLCGKDAERQIREDLWNLKQYLETTGVQAEAPGRRPDVPPRTGMTPGSYL